MEYLFIINVLCVIMFVLMAKIRFVYTTRNVLKEYCHWEKFTANCEQDEIIMMQSAFYGLMKENRCVDDDYLIYLGCSSNQLDYIDMKCSGFRNCEIDVYNKEMKDKIESICPEPYIEASYICQKVESTLSKCTTSHTIDIKAGSQYVSSFISKQTECGFGNTPLVLNAKPGQSINMTLLDFAWGTRTSGRWNKQKSCEQLYGHVLSHDGNVVDICGGSDRLRHLYTSSNHQVQLVFQQDLPQEIQFLIKFEAIGCPDYIPPKNTWLRKEGSNIVIGCQSTADYWQLKCVGSHWIGVIGNCTEASQSNQIIMAKEKGKEFSGHHVFAFAIGCIAVIICCVTVTLGIYCIHRYKIKVKSKTGNTGNSEMLLLPSTTWPRAGNTTLIRPGFNQDTVARNQIPGLHQRTPNDIATNDTESVQYFVLERPPGYSDNQEIGLG